MIIQNVLTLLLATQLFVSVHAELRWTQYSDRASLPKSKRERDRLRDLLSRVNEEYLTSAEDKRRYADLKAIFQEAEGMEQEASSLSSGGLTVILGLLGIAVALLLFKRWSNAQPLPTFDDLAREARLKKFLSLPSCFFNHFSDTILAGAKSRKFNPLIIIATISVSNKNGYIHVATTLWWVP